MKIDIITLFPDMFKGPFAESIVKRAVDKKLVEINIHNLRKWSKDKHKTVDDRPYGGGAGMVMMIEPIYKAIQTFKNQKTTLKEKNLKKTNNPKTSQNVAIATKCEEKVVLLSPQGKVFNQKMAQRLSKINHLILICGHYEGVDERVKEYIDEEISIGDYILTGGEIPAMVVVDSVVRLIPGVLEKPESTKQESFRSSTINHQSSIILEAPQYTRPENYKGLKVPAVLLSGNHQQIKEWREKKAIEKTKKNRPELLIKKPGF